MSCLRGGRTSGPQRKQLGVGKKGHGVKRGEPSSSRVRQKTATISKRWEKDQVNLRGGIPLLRREKGDQACRLGNRNSLGGSRKKNAKIPLLRNRFPSRARPEKRGGAFHLLDKTNFSKRQDRFPPDKEGTVSSVSWGKGGIG